MLSGFQSFCRSLSSFDFVVGKIEETLAIVRKWSKRIFVIYFRVKDKTNIPITNEYMIICIGKFCKYVFIYTYETREIRSSHFPAKTFWIRLFENFFSQT